MGTDPSVFISYSHSDKAVARAIADSLTRAGATVWIDEGELRVGDSIIERIATAVADVHFVVAIVSAASVGSRWCQKELSLATTGGLNREGIKVLPLRLGDVEMPASLRDTYYLSVDPEDPGAVVQRLLTDVRSHLLTTEPDTPRGGSAAFLKPSGSLRGGVAGTDPWADSHATGYASQIVREARRRGISPSEYSRSGLARPSASRAPRATGAIKSEAGPIKLTGIVREGVGRPRSDGMRGSALYAVPLRLSRAPSTDWARDLVQTWDHPPEFTTMHRPGILTVTRDVVTLDGVTIEEVERYHLRTLKICIEKVNQDIENHERRQAEAAELERRRIQVHEASIDDALDRLDFD